MPGIPSIPDCLENLFKKIRRYRNCIYYPTNTTTDIIRYAYSRAYNSIVPVWSVEGCWNKPAGMRPFLTSASDCRQWIKEQYMLVDEN